MDVSLLQWIGLIGIGLLTGSVVGLTGASGVVVVVPLLSVLMGFRCTRQLAPVYLWMSSLRCL